MKQAVILVLSLCIWMVRPSRGHARVEVAFRTLSDLVESSEYIVIAAIDHKSPELYNDGWVKYECRFLYWLKAPGEKLAELLIQQQRATVKPFPLYRLDVRGGGNYPPGAPRTNAVVLVDSHEKPYHRLIPDRPFMVRPKAVRAPLYPNYHLLFLRRSEDKQQYITVGTYHSILPVSPVLDIRQLPPEPHTDRDDQPRVEISLEKAIRFIVKDYVKFKESQLAEVSRDLKEVLKDRKVKKR